MLLYINPNEKTKMTNPVLSIDKEELAKNPNTPVETLIVLATDRDSYDWMSAANYITNYK